MLLRWFSFLNPCKCIGSLKFVHSKCLIEWIECKSSRKHLLKEGFECEICKHKIKYITEHKIGILKSLYLMIKSLSKPRVIIKTTYELLMSILLYKRLKLLLSDIIKIIKYKEGSIIFKIKAFLNNMLILCSIFLLMRDLISIIYNDYRKIRGVNYKFLSL